MRVRLFRYATILLVFVLACSRRGEAPAPPASQKPPEVAPPVGLLGELTVPDPRRLWTSLRKLGGSRADALPSSFELALFTAIDLPPRVAGYIHPETPVLGLLLAPPNAPTSFVLGVRTVRGAELVKELTSGANPAFNSAGNGSPVTILVGQKPTPLLAVVDDWLLVGLNTGALIAGGPYLAHGLAKKRLPPAPLRFEVKRGALSGPLSQAVKERWAALRTGLSQRADSARAERGRAPDFGDPAAVLGLADGSVGALLELLASSERLSLELTPDADRLELSLSVVPVAKGALAESLETLEVGPLDPLLALPKNVVLATLSRSSEAERSAAAERPADALRSVLGERLSEKDAAPLADALRSYHRGRGTVSVLGLLGNRTLFLRQDARDPKELERGLRGILRMLRTPALAEPLAPLVGKVNFRESETRVTGVEGPVQRIQVSQPGPQSPGVEVLVHVRGASALTVAQAAPSDALAVLTRTEEATLAKTPLEKLAAGRTPAALAAYADLAMLRPSAGPAPALAVLGKKGGEAHLELELSAPACAALVERFGSP